MRNQTKLLIAAAILAATPLSGAIARDHGQGLGASVRGTTEQASLNPVCRPWPPFGMLCTAGGWPDGTPSIRNPEEVRLAGRFGCPYTDWAGTGYGIPC